MITIVDYGIGNLNSILNMLKRIGVPAQISSDLKVIGAAEKLILPGVGAFDTAMGKIRTSGLKTVLDQKVLHEKRPILGICLGMQLLMDGSDEGSFPGLGWVPGRVRAFRGEIGREYKIPHMGWNTVTSRIPSSLTQDLLEKARFYFVHSYYVKCASSVNSLMKTTYGVEFDSVIRKDNVYGAQFHPEKSHRYGMKFLQNFAEI